MGKKANTLKDRVCLKCEQTVSQVTSGQLKQHAKACKGK